MDHPDDDFSDDGMDEIMANEVIQYECNPQTFFEDDEWTDFNLDEKFEDHPHVEIEKVMYF